MKHQRTVTIELEELKKFLREKLKIDANVADIHTEVVQNEETFKPAIRLTWTEGHKSSDEYWGR